MSDDARHATEAAIAFHTEHLWLGETCWAKGARALVMRHAHSMLTLAVCVAASVIVGRANGYTLASSYLAFWLATVLAATAGWRLARCLRVQASLTDVLISATVLAIAIAIGCTMIAGAIGRLTMRDVLVGHAVVFAVTLWATRSPDAVTIGDTMTLPPLVVAIAAATLAFSVAFGVWHAPLTLYDSVSYHLHFAARWVQDHAIEIIPTPFSDEAQAYAPGNGELLFAWLMLPFHGDVIARMGQLPFALLGALTVYGIARRLGQPAPHAVYPAVFFVLSRPVAEQMIGANVDLMCAACFLTSIYFAILAVDRDRASDWALFGVSAGLYGGSKYLALVYAPVVLALACARGPRARALWALPGIMAFACPWYLRNWIVAGSPIYPASVVVGGVTLARGAFTRAAMLNTIFHTTDLRLFPAMAAHVFGPALFIVWLPCAVAGWVIMARRGWWPHGTLAATPLLMVPLYWYGFPVNIDSRFLLPAVGPALLPLAFIFSEDRRWNACVHALYAVAMAWLLIGMRRSLPGALPWFMGGWLALDGLIRPQFLPWFAAMVGVVAAVWLLVRRSPQVALAALVSTIVCGATVLVLGAQRWCGDTACEYLDTTSPFIREGYLESWRWIAGNVTGATIAYTGINLPYPLTGPKLTNRVVYVNIDGRARWRFHDYDRAFRSGRFSPSPPVLATSSGELMPVVNRAGPRDDAVRPRYERMHGNRDAWIFNLETIGVRYVYVAMLSAYEIDYVWHNEGGFPIEDEWAASDPGRFHLAYANPQVRIYSIDIDRKARG